MHFSWATTSCRPLMESVQTHVLMGSIILAVCFSMSIEGYSGVQTERLLDTLWLLFTSWAATFTFVALWLALRFQMKISGSARERLLRRHRFMVPDDLVVGKMGGENLVDQMADFHNWVLTTMEDMTSAQTDEETLQQKCEPIFLKQGARPLRVPVETLDDEILDTEPLRKGLHAWLHESGEGYSQHKTLDVPYFLLGETCLRQPWVLQADGPSLKIRVFGDATLYVSAQCVPGDAPVAKSGSVGGSSPSSPVSAAGVRKALRLESSVPAWPGDELPLVRTGFNEKWRGESGYGEFRRVEGFSIFVDMERAMELPLYKIVLASPSDFGVDHIDVVVQWNFKTACEALTVVLRRGHVHCKEEDFPLAEFNSEVKKMLPVRRYAENYLATGIICLLVATFLLVAARMYNINNAHGWWAFEVLLGLLALLPGCVLLNLMPVEGLSGVVSQAIHSINSVDHAHEPKPSFLNQFRRTMSTQADGLRRKESNVGSDELSDELDEENNYSSDLAQRLADMDAFRLGEQQDDGEEEVDTSQPSARAEVESSVAFDCFSESVFCKDVMRASSEKINAVTSSCQRVWRVPPETLKPTVYRRRKSSLSDPQLHAPVKETVRYRASFVNQAQALWSDLRHGLERPRSLQFWTAVLHTLFLLSIISAVIVRFELGSGTEGTSRWTSISWIIMPAEWPAFFQPTAVEIADGQLFVATDGVVQKFQWSTQSFAPVGQAMAVPGTARGLSLVDGQLALISDEGYFDVRVVDASWTSSTSPSTSIGALGILDAGPQSWPAPNASLPSIERLSAAGALGGAVILASSDRMLRLCRCPASPAGQLEVLLELPTTGEFTALHLDATVLWAVLRTREVMAISLESGETLAQFDANLPSGATMVGLTGNSSHLVGVIVREGYEPQLVITPYPELPSATVEL